MDIRWDRYSFIIDGQRQMIRSGAMHYFRHPSQRTWKDRLTKLKAAGYNTVDLYFNWAFHSPQPGQADFTGLRDVRALLAMTRELDLWVIARPGPYINAEISGGGLPLWLLADPHVTPRNRNPHGEFVWCDRYMAAVREWWGQIVPIINETDNLLMLQIENEYATSGMEPDYMQALATMSREVGVTVPLMHNDMYAAGLYEDLVDIYAFDHYPVTHFESSLPGVKTDTWHNHPEVFSVIDAIEDTLRPFCAERPLMVTELQAGWFAGWIGADYPTLQRTLGREHIGLITKSLLGQGLTTFNHYMLIGGTNWGSLGSTDVLTSYDFAAPINEAGQLTERLFEAKALNQLLQGFDLTQTERRDLSEAGIELADPDQLFYAFRVIPPLPSTSPAADIPDLSHPGRDVGSGWLFLRNLNPDPKTVQWVIPGLSHAVEVTVPPFQLAMLPVNLLLQCGMRLQYCSTEPVYQTATQLFLKADRPLALQVLDVQGQAYPFTSPALAPDAKEEVQLGQLTVILLGNRCVDELWVEEKTGKVSCLKPESLPLLPQKTPSLAAWSFQHAAPEIYSGQHTGLVGVGQFKPVTELISHDAHLGRADFDALGVYEGCGWYQLQFMDDSPQALILTVDARHFCAVYWNGTLLGQGQHWASTPDDEGPRPTTFTIPAELVRGTRQANHLRVWVDSLGHPKGFHDDANLPQGLLALSLNGQDIRGQLSYSHGVSLWPQAQRELSAREHAPMVYAQTRFAPVDFDQPLMLDIEGLCCDLQPERVNIVLNNQLIGRTWSENPARLPSQTRFYLPEGLLSTHSDNTLALLIVRHRKPFILPDLALASDHVVLKGYDAS